MTTKEKYNFDNCWDGWPWHNNIQKFPKSKTPHWVNVLHLTWYKIGHFGDVLQANLLAWYGKTKPNTTKAHIQQSKEMYYNTK